MDGRTNPKSMHNKKLYGHILIMMLFMITLFTTLMVWGYTYSYEYTNSIQHGIDYHPFENYISENVDTYTSGFYMSEAPIYIAPFSTLPGPWGTGIYPNYRNVDLHIIRNNVHWPALNQPVARLSVPPSATSVHLNSSHHLPWPGIPVWAGHSLTSWHGARHVPNGQSITPPHLSAGGFLPAAVPVNVNHPSDMDLPVTNWIGLNDPTARYYPLHLTMGTNTDLTAFIRPHFTSIQLDMSDININTENRLAIANAPSPPIEFRRAVVSEYYTAPNDFTADTTIINLGWMFMAPLQFKLRNEHAFEFAPTGGITVNSPHHITTGFLGLMSSPGIFFGDIHATIAIVPRPGLGVGTYIEMVTSYQRGYEYIYENGVHNRVWHYAFPLAGSTALVPTHRTELEVRFVVERPATAVDIPIAEGPSRNTTVHVNYTYRDPNPNPDYYTYINSTPGFTYTIVDNAGDREIHMIIPPPRYTFFDYDPSDRWPICRESGDPLPISLPPGYGLISAVVDSDGNLVVVIGRAFYTITFLLNGGYIPGYGSADIVRTERIPGPTYVIGPTGPFTVPTDPFTPQYGVPNGTPTLTNIINYNYKFHGWLELNSFGDIINPAGPPLSSVEVANLIVNGNRTFLAIFSSRLEFTKTNFALYNNPLHEHPPQIIPRDGAAFELQWLNPDTGDWVTVYNALPSGSAVGAIPARPGMVVIGETFDPRLANNIHLTPPNNQSQQFRLVETIPPPGYRLGGPWSLNFTNDNAMEFSYNIPFGSELYFLGSGGMWNNPVNGMIPIGTETPFIYKYDDNDNREWFVGNRFRGMEFIKTDGSIFETFPIVINPLDGATFTLEIWDTAISDWEYIGTAISGACGTHGRVQFNHVALPDRLYRLKEIVAPTGFMLPDGHWYIDTTGFDVDSSAFSFPFGMTTPSEPSMHNFISHMNNVNSILFLGNDPIEEIIFYFHKTNAVVPTPNPYLLEHAVFWLFRYNGTGVPMAAPPPPADILISGDNNTIGSGPNQWTKVTEQTSSANPNEPMEFPMSPGHFYQLVEFSPPAGFQMPPGQWRITVTDTSPYLHIEVVSDIQMPNIWHYDGVFYIPNLLDFYLPLSGGLGTVAFSIVGFAALGTAGAASGWIFSRKQKKVVGRKISYKKIKARGLFHRRVNNKTRQKMVKD